MYKLLFPLLPALISLSIAGSPSADFKSSVQQLRVEKQLLQEVKTQAKENTKANQDLMISSRKGVLSKSIDIQLQWMERMKARVRAMPNITEEQKTQIAAEIDSAIQEINALKLELDNASDQNAIKALALKIRNQFKTKHDLVKKSVEAIHASRMNEISDKAERRAIAMKAKIGEMKNRGVDTANLETLLASAQSDIDSAEEKIGAGALKEANENLKSAYEKFRELAKNSAEKK